MPKARFKRRSSHAPKLMEMNKILSWSTFALGSAHEKSDVSTLPNIVNGFVFVINFLIFKYCWVARDVTAAMLVGSYKRILYYNQATKMAAMSLPSESQGID